MPIRFTPTSVLAFAYLGLVGSFAASTLYLVLLRRYTVTAVAYLRFGTATVAVMAGVLIAGEDLKTSHIIGVAAVLAGLLLLSRPEARQIKS